MNINSLYLYKDLNKFNKLNIKGVYGFIGQGKMLHIIPTAIHQKKLTADRKRYYSLITAKKILRQPDNQDGKLFYTIPLIMKNQAKNYSNFLEICLTLILKYLSTPLGT